jgi:hypothetical protein
MFYVFYKDIQANCFWFIPFYVRNDFFPSPLPNKSLPKYAKDIVQHMACLYSPKSSSIERTYEIGVVELDYEATKNLE